MSTTAEEGTAGHGRKSLKKIKDPVKFYPHQLDGVRTLARRRSFLLADEMGGGKAQPVGTPVATPDGWRPIGALEVGDVLCRPAGGTQRVLQVHPQGTIAVARVRFADGTSTLASWDHLWAAYDGSGGWSTLTTRTLHTGDLGDAQGKPRWEVPIPRPIEGATVDWPSGVDPFTLGFLYGGGLSFDSSDRSPTAVRIAKGRYEVAKQLFVPNAQVRFTDRAWLVANEDHPTALTEYLDIIGELGFRRQTGKREFPELIRFAPLADRMRFFLGMLAAAGQVDAATQHRLGFRFHQSTSRSVVNGTLELVRLLGGVAMADNLTKWVSIWWPTPIQLWSGTTISTTRPRKAITGIGPAGMAESVCITVDDPEGLYITEHGIVTHNSLQALTVAAIDYEIGTARKSLIVCPATLKDNWATEIADHTAFRALVCHGTKAKREKQLLQFRTDDSLDILIMNYEQVLGHLDDINACDLDILIFDEAHYLKSPKSKRTKACHKIAARRSFLLTGSPMLNQPQELWGILHRINPEEFPSFWKFSQRYCNTLDAPILMADGTFKLLGDVVIGDEVYGWETPDGKRRTSCVSVVKRIESRQAEVNEYTLDDGTTFKCTPDHLWLSGSHNQDQEWTTAEVSWKGKNPGTKLLSRIVNIPDELTPEQQREMDWLSGLYDGEGTWPFIAQCESHNPAVHARIRSALDLLGFDYRETATGYAVRGGRQAVVNFINMGTVTKQDRLVRSMHGGLNKQKVRVVSSRPLGVQEVMSMETTSGNYVAWGLASKNCVFGGFQAKQVTGVKNRIELLEILDRYMLRRLKKDMVKLPDKNFIPVHVPLSPLQARLYKEAETELRLEVPDRPEPMELENALTKILRLKQITGTPATLGFEDQSYKLDRCVEIVHELIDAGEKVVVFTQFRGVLAAIEQRLTAPTVPGHPKIDTFVLSGEVPGDKRVPIVHEWGDAARPGVLLSMLQVGGVGLDFTAASNVIFVDKLYVPAMNDQAVDRLHRLSMDKTKQVNIYEMLATKTVEDRVEKILARKRKMTDSVIDNAEFRKLIVAALHDED